MIRKASLDKVETFKNEVEINAALDHPNICKLYEVFEDAKNVYQADFNKTSGLPRPYIFDRLPEHIFLIDARTYF